MEDTWLLSFGSGRDLIVPYCTPLGLTTLMEHAVHLQYSVPNLEGHSIAFHRLF